VPERQGDVLGDLGLKINVVFTDISMHHQSMSILNPSMHSENKYYFDPE
jgi:hypothetical protein